MLTKSSVFAFYTHTHSNACDLSPNSRWRRPLFSFFPPKTHAMCSASQALNIGHECGLYNKLMFVCSPHPSQGHVGAVNPNLTSCAVCPKGEEAASAKLSAQNILETAYSMTNVMGSSTACVLALNGSTLTGSNLGDSGFMVIRAGEMLMATQQQQHSFNFPFQLGGAEAMGDHPAQVRGWQFRGST